LKILLLGFIFKNLDLNFFDTCNNPIEKMKDKCFVAHLLNKWSLWLYVSNDCCETHEFYIPFSTRNVHQTCKCHCCSRLLILQTFVIAHEIMFFKHPIMHDVEGFLFDFKDNVLVHIIYHLCFLLMHKTLAIRNHLCVVVLFVIFAIFLTILQFLSAFCNLFWSENVNQSLAFWRVWCPIKVKCHCHLMLLLRVLPLTSL